MKTTIIHGIHSIYFYPLCGMFLLWFFQMWCVILWDSLIGIMTSLWSRWARYHGWFLAQGKRFFSLPQSMQTGSGSRTASCSVGNRCPFLVCVGGAVLSHEADHSPSHNVKIKKFWVVPPLPTCHLGMHSNSFNLYTLLLFH